MQSESYNGLVSSYVHPELAEALLVQARGGCRRAWIALLALDPMNPLPLVEGMGAVVERAWREGTAGASPCDDSLDRGPLAGFARAWGDLLMASFYGMDRGERERIAPLLVAVCKEAGRLPGSAKVAA